VDVFIAPWQVAAILFVLGVLFLGLSVWLRMRWESHLVNTVAVDRTVRVNLFGFALILGGAIVFLASSAPPVAVVLLAVSAIWLVVCLRGRPRRIHVESETVFRCTPEEAFALLAEPRKEPLYCPELERIEVLSVGALAIGTVIRGWVRLPRDSSGPGLYLVAEEVITQYHPPHAYASRIVGKPAETRLLFNAVGDGTKVVAAYDSLIEFEVAGTGGIFFRGEAEQRILKNRQEAWERARLILEHRAA